MPEALKALGEPAEPMLQEWPNRCRLRRRGVHCSRHTYLRLARMMRTLYGYWRSTAAYRVRIALGLKSLHSESMSINLCDGEQLGEAFNKIKQQSRSKGG